MSPRRLLRRLNSGSLQNVSFADLRRLVEALGFKLDRSRGSHHIFVHPAVHEILNLQSVDGRAKPYQIRQILKVVERYNLRLGADH